MKTAIMAAVAAFAKSPFAHACSKIGQVVDCAIPIALFIAIIASGVVIGFGLIK